MDATPPRAWEAFRRAREGSAGYRRFLDERGLSQPASWEQIPFTDKGLVFGRPGWPEWVLAPGIAGARELVTSSGQSGVFSLGVADASEREGLGERVDGLLAQLGATPQSPTLLVNCLPMGIAVPTSLATVISPSTHFEMALEALLVLSPHFDRIVLLGEPLFLKELAERRRELVGPIGLGRPLVIMTGGEFLAESLRADLAHLFSLSSPADGAVLCSMGAAELGLHVLFETPELIGARMMLAGAPGAREALFGEDPGYAPSLFAFDPRRFHLEERVHSDGARTLVATTLEPVALPLVRYDLGDLASLLEPSQLAEALELDPEMFGDGELVAIHGRNLEAEGAGWSLRVERVKERLFADPGLARALTGRFYLDAGEGPLTLHLERRGRLVPEPAALESLGSWLRSVTDSDAILDVHPVGGYPYHQAGDWQHKPRYVGALGWGRQHAGASA